MRHNHLSTYYASWIEKELGSKNIRIHRGYNQLRLGEFPERLAETIKECRNLIVILTPSTFGNEDDNTNWMAYEIETAIKANVNIIPVTTADFIWPEKLPERVNGLQDFECVVMRECRGLSSDYEYIKPALQAIASRVISNEKCDVFISYSSKDSLIANEIKYNLKLHNISCWMAPQSIPTGSNYQTEVLNAIKNSKIFLLVLSENSQNSTYVKKELDLAILENSNINLILKLMQMLILI